MQIYYRDAASPSGDAWKLYRDRTHNRIDFDDREEAEKIARRLANHHATETQVRVGNSILAEFDGGYSWAEQTAPTQE